MPVMPRISPLLIVNERLSIALTPSALRVVTFLSSILSCGLTGAVLCDRIMVINSGKITGMLDGRNTTKEEIGLLMTKTEAREEA